MPHTNSILVLHPNGTFYAQRHKVQYLVDHKRAYWRDRGCTVLVILKSTDDERNNGYEYRGGKSYDGTATAIVVNGKTGIAKEIPIETRDKTGIPVREPGGAKTLQMRPLSDRRTNNQHSPNPDKLWHPSRHRRK